MFYNTFSLIKYNYKYKFLLFIILFGILFFSSILFLNDYTILKKIIVYKLLFFLKWYNHSSFFISNLYGFSIQNVTLLFYVDFNNFPLNSTNNWSNTYLILKLNKYYSSYVIYGFIYFYKYIVFIFFLKTVLNNFIFLNRNFIKISLCILISFSFFIILNIFIFFYLVLLILKIHIVLILLFFILLLGIILVHKYFIYALKLFLIAI